MFAPGLIAAAFYRRPPSRNQIVLGAFFTIAGSALLGYLQDVGTSRVWENAALAVGLGLVIYAAILAYLLRIYFPKRNAALPPDRPTPPVARP